MFSGLKHQNSESDPDLAARVVSSSAISAPFSYFYQESGLFWGASEILQWDTAATCGVCIVRWVSPSVNGGPSLIFVLSRPHSGYYYTHLTGPDRATSE